MSTMEDIQVITSLVAVQVLEVGLNTLIKAESGKGMSHYVFIVYSNAMSLSLLLSYSFFYYRKRPCSPISTSIICKIFLLGCLRYIHVPSTQLLFGYVVITYLHININYDGLITEICLWQLWITDISIYWNWIQLPRSCFCYG